MTKMPVILAACLLLFSALAAAEESFTPVECCFSYQTKPVRKDNVVTFQRTGTHCAKDGVVFTMMKGDKLCVDRTQDWVQKAIFHVEAKAAGK